MLKTKSRNLGDNQDENTVEKISIDIKKIKASGFFKSKQMMASPCLKVVFTRFLFFNELKFLKGLDYVLQKIHFGNDIEVYSNQLELSLFKEDFFFLMSILYNNILFTDNMDQSYNKGYTDSKKIGYVPPMNISVLFSKLKVVFRYDYSENDQEVKPYLNFSLHNFLVDLKKSIRNESKIQILAREVTSRAFQFIEGVKVPNDNQSVFFIRPISEEKKNEGFKRRLNTVALNTEEEFELMHARTSIADDIITHNQAKYSHDDLFQSK